MPLYKRKPYPPAPPVPGARPDEELFVIRYTGEAFRSYEEYLARVALYRERAWACKHSGRTGLTFEEALASEARSAAHAKDAFPERHKAAAAAIVHGSMLRLDDLVTSVYEAARSDFAVGEVVLCAREGADALEPCVIVSEVPSAYIPSHDRHGAASAVAGEPHYEVEWAAGQLTGLVPCSSLRRAKHPIPRSVVRSWILDVATQPAGKVGPWAVRPSVARRYGLGEGGAADGLKRGLTPHLERVLAEVRAARERTRAAAKARGRAAKEAAAVATAAIPSAAAEAMQEAAPSAAGGTSPAVGKLVVLEPPRAKAAMEAPPAKVSVGVAAVAPKKAGEGGRRLSWLPSATSNGGAWPSPRSKLSRSAAGPGWRSAAHFDTQDMEDELLLAQRAAAAADVSSRHHKTPPQPPPPPPPPPSPPLVVVRKSQAKPAQRRPAAGVEAAASTLVAHRMGMAAGGSVKASEHPSSWRVEEAPTAPDNGRRQEAEAGGGRPNALSREDEQDEDSEEPSNKERCSRLFLAEWQHGATGLLLQRVPAVRVPYGVAAAVVRQLPTVVPPSLPQPSIGRLAMVPCHQQGSDDLPEGEWHCPKCVASQAKAAHMEMRVLERQQRQTERDQRHRERERARLEEREDRERRRLEEKAERKKQRMEEREEQARLREEERERKRLERMLADRRLQYPIEDLEVEEREREEELLAVAAGIEPPLPRPRCPPPRPVVLGQDGGIAPSLVGDVLEVWNFFQVLGQRLKSPQVSIPELVAALVQPRTGGVVTNLYTSLMRGIIQAGAGWLPGGVDADVCVAEEETLARWERLVDGAPWQEVIRRYLVRGYRHLPETLKQSVDALGMMDIHNIRPAVQLEIIRCLCNDYLEAESTKDFLEQNLEAAADLRRQRYMEDVELRRQRNEETRRLKEERKVVGAARNSEPVPEKRQPMPKDGQEEDEADKEDAEEEEEEKQDEDGTGGKAGSLLEEDADGIEDDEEDDELAFKLPEDVKVFGGDPQDRRAVLAHRDMVRKEEERLHSLKVEWRKKREQARKAILDESKIAKRAKATERRKKEAQMRADDEVRRKRDEACEKELGKLTLGADPIGWDRHHNRYWSFAADRSVLFVEEAREPTQAAGDGPRGTWKGYDTREELTALLAALNEKGVREMALKEALLRVHKQIKQSMRRGEKLRGELGPAVEGPCNLLRELGGEPPSKQEGSTSRDSGLALSFEAGFVSKLRAFADCLEAHSLHDLHPRIDAAATLEEHAAVLLKLEGLVCESASATSGSAESVPNRGADGTVEADTDDEEGEEAGEAMTLSELEDEEEVAGTRDGKGLKGLWKTARARKLWRREVEEARTFSRLAYAVSSLWERCEVLWGSAASVSKKRGVKRSASIALLAQRPPATQPKEEESSVDKDEDGYSRQRDKEGASDTSGEEMDEELDGADTMKRLTRSKKKSKSMSAINRAPSDEVANSSKEGGACSSCGLGVAPHRNCVSWLCSDCSKQGGGELFRKPVKDAASNIGKECRLPREACQSEDGNDERPGHGDAGSGGARKLERQSQALRFLRPRRDAQAGAASDVTTGESSQVFRRVTRSSRH
eukprot:SM000008S22340  [mRNA]  locus=s8:1154116:1161870:- [translate_table: standard]